MNTLINTTPTNKISGELHKDIIGGVDDRLEQHVCHEIYLELYDELFDKFYAMQAHEIENKINK